MNAQYNYQQHTANHILGAGLALGLLIDGVQANIEPDCVNDLQQAELASIYASLSDAAARLIKVAQEVQFE